MYTPRHTPGSKCPAIGGTCHKCKKKGHFSARCLSKLIAIVSTSEDEERAFLGAMTLSKKQKSWLVEVQLNGHAISFKMDTGAEVTAITEETYRKLGQPTLSKPTKVLYRPACNVLKVLGQFPGKLVHGEHSTRGTTGLRKNLLSLPEITALQLASRVDAVSEDKKTKACRSRSSPGSSKDWG